MLAEKLRHHGRASNTLPMQRQLQMIDAQAPQMRRIHYLRSCPVLVQMWEG